MLLAFWPNMPGLDCLDELLQAGGDTLILGGRTLRFIPFDARYPTFYFNMGGSIDIPVPAEDLFYRQDCLDILAQWLGKPLTTWEY